MIFVYELMVHSWKRTSFNKWNNKVKNSLYAKKTQLVVGNQIFNLNLGNFDKLQFMQIILLIHNFFTQTNDVLGRNLGIAVLEKQIGVWERGVL